MAHDDTLRIPRRGGPLLVHALRPSDAPEAPGKVRQHKRGYDHCLERASDVEWAEQHALRIKQHRLRVVREMRRLAYRGRR